MDLLMELASGGLTGFIGTIGASLLGAWKAKQEHEQRLDIMKLEHLHTQDEINLEADRREDELEIERDTAAIKADGKALAASYKLAGTEMTWEGSKLLEIAEYIRRTFRPKITLLLLILTGIIYATGTNEIRVMVAQSIIVLTGTAIGWFFGSREVNKRATAT